MIIYKLRAPENSRKLKEFTYSEEIPINNGIALCHTCTGKQVLEARGYKLIEQLEEEPPKIEVVEKKGLVKIKKSSRIIRRSVRKSSRNKNDSIDIEIINYKQG